MKLIYIKRKTDYETRYSVKMGVLTTKITYIKKYLLGYPIKTLHKHRLTYYGQVKDAKDSMLFI